MYFKASYATAAIQRIFNSNEIKFALQLNDRGKGKMKNTLIACQKHLPYIA